MIEEFHTNYNGDDTVDSVIIYAKNPHFVLDGEVKGYGKVIIPSLNKYSSDFEEVILKDKFIIDIHDSSGLLYISVVPT